MEQINYDNLKQVIHQANPEIMVEGVWFGKVKKRPREIRLADVLLAIGENPKCVFLYQPNAKAVFLKVEREFIQTPACDWNLKDDNLDHQSDETKQFLINLLIPSNRMRAQQTSILN